jgi:hypothetical protein
MPLYVGEAVNQMADKVMTLPIIRGMAKNPFYTALMIALIVFLTVLWVFRDVDMKDNLLTLSLRTGIYCLLICTGIMFLHNRSLSDETAKSRESEEIDAVFTPTPTGGVEEKVELVPVKLDVNFNK